MTIFIEFKNSLVIIDFTDEFTLRSFRIRNNQNLELNKDVFYSCFLSVYK